MARQTMLIDKNNTIIDPFYNKSMPENTRSHTGYAVVRASKHEKKVFNKGDKVIIWTKNGKMRAFSAKHARKKAIKHIYITEHLRFLSNKNTGAISQGKLLNYPCNKDFLTTNTLKEAATCLIKYWQHCLNPYLKTYQTEPRLKL